MLGYILNRINVGGVLQKMRFIMNINKKTFLLAGFTLTLLSSCSNMDEVNNTSVQEASTKPNVVYIVVDDLGYSDIGAYNKDSFYQTPNIDTLASQGIQFTDGYAANPVCSPSRFALLTGKHPTRGQATDWFPHKNKPSRSGHFNAADFERVLPHKETTIAEAFKEQGYSTAFLGKWHLGEDESFWPEHQGFDVNIGGTMNGHPPAGYFSPYKNPRLSDGPKGEYLTQRLTDEAINLVDGYSKKSDPFFMMLAFYTVHTPLQAPEEDVQKYNAKRDEANLENSFIEGEQVWPIDEARNIRVKQNHSTYAAMVNQMDTQVGRLLNKLKASGLDKNTIVVFTSDNGGLSTAEGAPTSNLPLRGGKGWLYEGGIRVPFIVKIPNMPNQGQLVATPVISNDLYPTLLAAAGLPLKPQQHIDGRDLSKMLMGKASYNELSDRAMYFHYPHYSNQGGFPGAAVRLGDWKLIERFENGVVHLYNLRKDIEEQHDLATEYPEKVNELRTKLHNWYKETDARFLQAKDGKQPWRPEA